MARRIRTFGIMAFLAVSLAVFAYVAASGGGSETTDEPPRYIEPRESEPVSQVGQGGTARMSLPVSMRPGCLNPYLPGCRGAENLNGVVFEAPLALAPSGEHRPALAAGMPSYGDGTLSLDPMTVELRLRQNASFSDGEPVTGEDVEWTYEQAAELADEGRISPMYSGFTRLEEVEVTGPKTVSLVFDGPYSEWQNLLTAPVLPAHVYGERDFDSLPLDEDPVGSGPFLLGEMAEGGIAFTANARYWRAMLEFPRLDGLEVEFAGPNRASESLASGRADFGFFTQPGTAPDSGGLLRSEAHRDRTEVLVFNSRRMNDDLRESAAESLDRRAMLSDGLDPTGSVFPGATPPESGWGGGSESAASAIPAEPLTLAYPTGGPARDEAAEAVVEQLEAAGIPAEAEGFAPDEYFRDVFPSGDFDLAMMDFASPAEYEAITPFLPDNSARAVSLSLSEMEDREQYFAQTQRIMASEDALLPLHVWPDSYVWSSTLSGPEPETPQRSVAWNVGEWGFFK
jgi:peptide/nickel transport system substrate-binding protein